MTPKSDSQSNPEKPKRTRRWLDHLLSPAGEFQGGFWRFGVRSLRTIYLAYREFIADFAWERAAALTFVTIISLLPITVLILNLFSIFWSDQDLRTYVKDKVDEYVFQVDLTEEKEVVPEAPSEPESPTNSESSEAESSSNEPSIQDVIHSWIDRSISRDMLQVNVQNNLKALITLVLSALALLVSGERVFNRIWKVEGTRTYFQKFVAFWMILTTSPLLVTATFFVEGLAGEGSAVGSFLKTYHLQEALYGFIVPILIGWVAFSLIYLLLPMTQVKILPALIGGGFSSISFFLLRKYLFKPYFYQAMKLEAFYDSLATIPIFLVFVYVAWIIILAGGELTYAIQNHDQLLRTHRLRRAAERYSAIFLGLFCLERIMKAFYQGAESPSRVDLAEELNVHPEELQPVLGSLCEMGVLAESAQSGDPLYLPTKSPEATPLRDAVENLLLLGQREELQSQRSASQIPEVQIHRQSRDAYLSYFDGKFLSDLGKEDSLKLSELPLNSPPLLLDSPGESDS